MAKDKAYRAAEKKIAQARKENATELVFRGMNLTEVPESLGQLSQLQKLYLEINQLTALPESLGQLSLLNTLLLQQNHLSVLPESLGKLTKLRVINVENNRLTALPESLGQLSELRHLYLASNQLKTLPTSVGDLAQLRMLRLHNNQLTALPESLGQLANLHAISLQGNPALDIPDEVLSFGTSNVLDYYFRTRKPEERTPLNEAKLILVGRGGVGKTSLVNRLVRDTFDPAENKTEGIQITNWPVQVPKRVAGQRVAGVESSRPRQSTDKDRGLEDSTPATQDEPATLDDSSAPEFEEARLHVWDFGGQEIMHATHQFFLTQRSLYLLVLSGREGAEDSDAEYWLRLIDSFGSGSPVIVVLNKIRETPFDVNRQALQSKYPGIREFIPTDCDDRTGIDELAAAIRRETDRLENLRVAFPAAWFEIKQKLSGEEARQRNYLTYREYQEFCGRHGEPDEKEQRMLAGYLHQLGIALNYSDDPRLHDHHVLNPHWVTTGIYRLLNASKLADQQGELRLADVAGILRGDDYPPQMHRFLLDLMKKFELCFTYPTRDESHYLVPELLSKQEPPEAAEFQPAECLNFQYHYPVIPEGLLPRFIVRTHVLSEGLPQWRTGVILQFDGNRALVKADPAEKQVFISVDGPAAGRRRLLAVIRADFETIHRDIPRLNPQEMVPVPGHPQTVVAYQELLLREEKGLLEFEVMVDGDFVKVAVPELLGEVDVGSPSTAAQMELIRRKGPAVMASITWWDDRVRLFYSYSHKDEHLRNELQTHLKLLERQDRIAPWHDRLITAGQEWKGEIDRKLEAADIVLLLVSADFIASDYCYDVEMQRALERRAAGEAEVITVILRPYNGWQEAGIGPADAMGRTQLKLGDLQVLPKDAKPIVEWGKENRDAAWSSVAAGIEKAVDRIRKQR